MWDTKQESKIKQNGLTDTDSMVVTREEEGRGKDEEGKGGQTYGDGRIDFRL